MKFIISTLLFCNLFLCCYSQVYQNSSNTFVAKEYSKDIALYSSKYFLLNSILGSSTDITKFEITPLAAAASGDLTTLIYKSKDKAKEGLILAFYGDYTNKFGVVYKGYDFKHLDKNDASEFLNKIQSAIDSNKDYLYDEFDNNNIYFRYQDIDVLIWRSSLGNTIRLFWNNFDSFWEQTAFDRSKRRFERKIK
jgi:hypothetical protein